MVIIESGTEREREHRNARCEFKKITTNFMSGPRGPFGDLMIPQ